MPCAFAGTERFAGAATAVQKSVEGAAQQSRGSDEGPNDGRVTRTAISSGQ